MEEDLFMYKDIFYKEYNIIDFFVKTLDEIKTQIEFYGYICEKDFRIFSHKAEKGLKHLESLKASLSSYKDEPSNLFFIENELVIKVLHIIFSTYKKLYPDCLKSIKLSIIPLCQNLENTKKDIIKNSLSMIKQSLNEHNKDELTKYLQETIELVMINAFKGLFNLYQLILIYSKKKNNLYLTIKNTIEEKVTSDEINIIINDISERKYAQKYNVNYEPIHFGNNVYKTLLTDEANDVMELSNSYLNYITVFIKCIQIRKKIIKELRLFVDILRKKNQDMIPKIKKICEKITSKTKKLIHSSPGIINTWNLVFSSWNSILTANMSYLQYDEEVCSPQLTKHIDECNEEYKTFEKKWEKYADKIKELRKKYEKYNHKNTKKEENKEEIKNEKKKREEKLKNYLMLDCNDFLDRNIPALRDNELKRMNEIKDLADKLKVVIKKNLEEFIENTENEYDNAASIDLFEEIQTMFESQLESLQINNLENYMEILKEKMSEIDFNDNLAANARISLAEYYDHNNNFDDAFDFSGGEIENPFASTSTSNIIKEKDIESNNLDGKEIIGKIVGIKEDEISSIKKSENNKINEYSTPNFKEEKEKEKENIINDNNNKINNDSLNFIQNINSAFTIEEKANDNKNNEINNKINSLQKKNTIHDSKRNIYNLAGNTLCCLRGGNIDINNEIDSFNNEQIDNIAEINSNDSFISSDENLTGNNGKKDDIQNNNNKLTEPIIKSKINDINIEKQLKTENKPINKNPEKNSNKSLNNNKNIDQNNIKNTKKIIQENQAMNYGMLGIIGLFCLKSLFTSNNIFSADFMLNLIILGTIGFIIYKSQFK